MLSRLIVTEPPKIISYYLLSRSTWPLSNNKEVFCHLCRAMPDESLTTGLLICAKPTRRRDQSTSSTLHKSSQVHIITNQVFIHKSKCGSEFKQQKIKLAEDTHGRPSIEYHSSSTRSHSISQPSGIEPGQMGLLENHNKSRAENTNTKQDLPDKNKIRLECKAFWLLGLFCQKRLRVDPYFQILAPILVC
jgi:hypothetical protein